MNKPRHTEGNIKKTFGLIQLNAKTSMSIERLRVYEDWTDTAYSRMNKGSRTERLLNEEYAKTKREIKDAFERLRTSVDEKDAAGSVAGVGGIGGHTKKVKEVLD